MSASSVSVSASSNITCIEEISAFRRGINTSIVVFPLSEVIDLLTKGALLKSEFNRNEVKARVGNADELFQTIAMGQCIGIVYASWDGVGRTILTPENPGKISEGGHRVISWIPKIYEGKALLCGKSLHEIQTDYPDLYRQIMVYKITFWITTHESGKVPVSYMKSEYQRCNTMTAVLTNGEVLRASENDKHNELVEKLLTEVIAKHKGTDVREKQRELATALVNGVLYGADAMNTKKTLLEDASKTVAPADFARANAILDKYIEIENRVNNLFTEQVIPEGASKAERASLKEANKIVANRRKIFAGRICSLAFDGPLLTALMGDDMAAVAESIHSFYEISVHNKETWKANYTSVCEAGPGNTARYYNKRRFEHGWGRLQSIVNPRAVEVSGGSGVGTVIA
jgi:hypothetical protein